MSLTLARAPAEVQPGPSGSDKRYRHDLHDPDKQLRSMCHWHRLRGSLVSSAAQADMCLTQ